MKFYHLIGLGVLSLSIQAQITTQASLDFSNPRTINPMLYGYNQNHSTPGADENWGSHRLGGNRMSVFNWENGASNTGADNASFNNDNRIPSLLGVKWADKDNVGEAYRKFHQDNLDENVSSIVTVPILGFVAADKSGSNLTNPPSSRWRYTVAQKSGSLSMTPNLTDDSVFVDESVYWLKQTFGDATTLNGVKYIALDNEPGLWNHTHSGVQTTDLNAADYVAKVIEAAIAVKSVDPNIKIIVGEFAGINKFDLSNAPDWATVGSGYDWFISYFLDELKKASDIEGYNLADYISFHFYPQDKIDSNGDFSGSGTKVLNSTSTSNHIRRARLQFVRSLWDESYIEPSWLTGSKLNNESHKALIRFQNSIDTYFPGVGIMIGEWDLGDDEDVTHGIATVDALGAMAQYGVDIANRWDLNTSSSDPYTKPAYKLYRNYDGLNSTYGNSVVETSFDNKIKSAVWASIDSDDNDLHIMVINKSLTNQNNFKIALNTTGFTTSIKEIWGMNSSSTTLNQPTHNGVISSDTLLISLPALNSYHVVISRDIISGAQNIKKNAAFYLSQKSPNVFTIHGIKPNDDWQVINIEGRLIKRGIGSVMNIEKFARGSYYLKCRGSSIKFVKK